MTSKGGSSRAWGFPGHARQPRGLQWRLQPRVVTTAAPLALALLFVTRVARADGSETDRQVAQTLFDDGRALMEQGRYAEACPKFGESHRLDPAPGSLLNLALCHELQGMTATALREFRDALSWAHRDADRDRQELAEQHIAALMPGLTRLTVVVPESVSAAGGEVKLDGSQLPREAWNTAIPVDPGKHTVTMSTRGFSPWEKRISTTEPGEVYRIEVVARVLGCPSGQTPQGDHCVAADGSRRSAAFWVLLSGAGLSFATSAVTGVLALNANAYVKDNCSAERSFCRVDDAQEAASRARTLAWVSTGTLVLGAGAGVAAFLLPKAKSMGAGTVGIGFQRDAAFATFEFSPRSW